MNIFHCCVQKTASQWIRRFFSDPKIIELTGLQPHNYYKQLRLAEDDERIQSLTTFSEPFPENTIVTPLYVNFKKFEQIPKPQQYSAFFVVRDPRDLVVSWYFSTTYSHFPNPSVKSFRDRLVQLPLQEGLILAIDILRDGAYFSSLASWLEGIKVDPNVTIVKFEEITAPETSLASFEHLFEHCKLPFDTEAVSAVLEELRFEKLAKRKQGVEDIYSHYRKGIEGDWIHHFDDTVEQKFHEVVGSLPYDLGYRSTKVDLLKKQLVRAQVYLQEAQVELQELQQKQVQSSGVDSGTPPIAKKRGDAKVKPESNNNGQAAQPPEVVAQQVTQLSARLSKSDQRVKRLNHRTKQLNQKLKRVRKNLRTANLTIEAMSSSKFWKLRNLWFRLFKQDRLASESPAVTASKEIPSPTAKASALPSTQPPPRSTQTNSQINTYITSGEAHVKEGQFEAAIAAYKTALQLDPRPPLKAYMGLGEALRKSGQLREAVEVYRNAQKAYPQQSPPYRVLGFTFRSLGDVSQGIENLQKAIHLDAKQPSGVYASLGELLSRRGDYEAAITAYQTAIELKPDSFTKTFVGLGEAFRKTGRLKEALEIYEKVLPAEQTQTLSEEFYLTLRHLQAHFGDHAAAQRTYEKIVANRFLINHEHKIIYCPIQKNACSLLVTMMVQLSPERSEFEQSGCKHVHEYLYKTRHSKVKLGDVSRLQSDYFKFLILRNPFDRLVSGYLDKFAKPIELLPFEARVVESIYRYEGRHPDFQQGINFRQFVQFLARTADYELDEHWRSQQSFIDMDGLKFDYIGQFEKINDVIDFLESKFSIKIATDRFNHITTYRQFDERDQFNEMYPAQLRQLEGGFPKSTQLYTPELEALVRERYAKDIELYENAFGVSLAHYLR